MPQAFDRGRRRAGLHQLAAVDYASPPVRDPRRQHHPPADRAEDHRPILVANSRSTFENACGGSSWKPFEQRRFIELLASDQHVSHQPYMTWSYELYVPGHTARHPHVPGHTARHGARGVSRRFGCGPERPQAAVAEAERRGLPGTSVGGVDGAVGTRRRGGKATPLIAGMCWM